MLINEVSRNRPDITFVYSNLYVKPSTLKKLCNKTWLAGYTNDNPYGNRKYYFKWNNFKKAIPFYHSWHVYRPANIEDFKNAGCENVKLLMSYYLPWDVNRDYKLPRKKFEYDVVFVGHCEKDERINYITDLVKSGISIRIFGESKYWYRYMDKNILRKLPPINAVFGSDYREVVRKSRICLNFLSKINNDKYTRRNFEITSWGGFMLSQRSTILKNLFVEGEDAEYFNSSKELIAKCYFYLKNGDLREKTAQRGQLKCLSCGHDVISRMKQWLNDTKRFINKNDY